MTLAYAEAVYQMKDALTASESAVLACLALAANDGGACWMRRSVIAARVRLHPDTVKTVLQALSAKKLICKGERHRDDGSQSANLLQMLFPAHDLRPDKRGDTPPWGGSYAPVVAKPPGADDPRGPGAIRPPHESSLEPSGKQDSPRKAPRGPVVSDQAKALAKAVHDLYPKKVRGRSTLPEVEKAVDVAIRDRKADPAQVVAAVAAYIEAEGRDDGQYLKAPHRLIQGDRWRAFLPEDWSPGAAAPGMGVPPTDDERAAHIDRVWTRRIEDFKRIGAWQRPDYGPRPGEPGCRVPAHVLAVCGLAGGAAA